MEIEEDQKAENESPHLINHIRKRLSSTIVFSAFSEEKKEEDNSPIEFPAIAKRRVSSEVVQEPPKYVGQYLEKILNVYQCVLREISVIINANNILEYGPQTCRRL